MFNVVNPDVIVEKYGADTLRMYEMFLGPIEQSKPWDTNGIDGCHRFLRKMWGVQSLKKNAEAYEILVDNQTALNNVSRFAKNAGKTVSFTESGEDYIIEVK